MSNPVNTPATVAPDSPTTEAPTPVQSSPSADARMSMSPSLRKAAAVQNSKAAAPKEPTPAEAKAVQAEIRRLKLKMDGQELELPEDEVVKLAQKAGTSDRRFQEAAALRQQVATQKQDVENVLRYLKQQPAAVLRKLVDDPAAYEALLMSELTSLVERKIESPEARRFREQEEELRSYKQREKAEHDRREATQRQAQEEHWARHYTEQFSRALDATGLPKNAKTMQRLVSLQMLCLKKGLEASPEQLAARVRREYEEELRTITDGYDGDKLGTFLGEGALKNLSASQLKKLKQAGIQYSKPREPTISAERRQEPRQAKGSWRELMKRNRMSG